mmetsp:Transcript_45188/g.113654  ORF Transcript_45188/g.113654 Transcript_45188/m.113654 type:complete len:325 (+) Transcript_45188:636-1610(+)
MGHVHTLVAEVASDLVHTIQATDHKHLEIQLRCYTHEEVQVQLVVVRDERLCRGAARDHVHHWCLNLQEAARVQVVPNEVDDLGPSVEGCPDIVVDHEVQVALAESDLLVLQALVILGQHVQASCQQLHLPREDGELPRLGLAHEAPHAHDVTAVDVTVGFLEVTNLVMLRLAHDLDPAAISREVIKHHVCALRPLVLHASCDANFRALLLCLGGHVLVLYNERRDRGVDGPLVRIRVLHRLDHGHPVFTVLCRIKVLHVRLGRLAPCRLLLRSLLGSLLLLFLLPLLGLRLLLQALTLGGRQLVRGSLRHVVAPHRCVRVGRA